MADGTGISWTDATWNPVRGCSRVSEGCRNCYAERVAGRFSGPGQPYQGLVRFAQRSEARWNGTVRMVPEHLADPLRWRKPRRIFVNSMSDLFHESLTNEQIAAVFGVMAAAPQHTFQVLTKRAARMREWFEWMAELVDIDGDPWTTLMHETTCWLAKDRAWGNYLNEHDSIEDACFEPWPLPNVWLGVSVENQAAADERIPDLLATPAEVRFLSCEPLLGQIDLSPWLGANDVADRARAQPIHWIIGGCESGPGARPCDVAWLRSLRDQCADAAVPYFLKQAVGEVGVLARDPVACRDGSKRKPGGIIELPYLDGVQHAAFPVPDYRHSADTE